MVDTHLQLRHDGVADKHWLLERQALVQVDRTVDRPPKQRGKQRRHQNAVHDRAAVHCVLGKIGVHVQRVAVAAQLGKRLDVTLYISCLLYTSPSPRDRG